VVIITGAVLCNDLVISVKASWLRRILAQRFGGNNRCNSAVIPNTVICRPSTPIWVGRKRSTGLCIGPKSNVWLGSTYTLSVYERAAVERRAISFRACSLRNLVYRAHFSLDDFAAFRCDNLIEWQGQTTVSFGMLGRVAQIFLS
jgi:hypothetical protein